ncbi:hypothetical protein J6590_022735 [Homalodisca vitripennis]|nr:hypothetical protein J6590_022735 [Homalodisca vitripennis]
MNPYDLWHRGPQQTRPLQEQLLHFGIYSGPRVYFAILVRDATHVALHDQPVTAL